MPEIPGATPLTPPQQNHVESWGMHAESSPLFAEYLKLTAEAQWQDLLIKESLTVGPQDALVVVDMQNDFLPTDDVNPLGGAFAVAEGGHISKLVVQLMEHFAACGSTVIATRDYHPIDHVSFIPHGGPFPPHCIQGHVGSHFYKPIGACIRKLQTLGRSAEIVFKGFHEDIDSFGSFQYADDERTFGRVCNRQGGPSGLHGCTLAAWTGCVKLKCSNSEESVDAPPDILAAHRRQTLSDVLKEKNIKRIFACGLALDYCVLDTAINGKGNGFEESYLILDAARAAHLPGIGSFGSGFLQDPVELKNKLAAAGVRLMPASRCMPQLQVQNPLSFQELGAGVFPAQLGPFALVPSPRLKIALDVKGGKYTASAPSQEIADLRQYNVEPEGRLCPLAPITLEKKSREALGIPDSAKSFAWGYPPSGGNFDEKTRGYFSITTPAAAFFIFGGFIYTNEKDEVVAVMARALGSGLQFSAPSKWQAKYSASLQSRWQPVVARMMQKKGAKLYAWINPGEALEASGEKSWTVAQHGAFAYLFHDDPLQEDPRDIYFEVVDKRQAMQTNLGSMSRRDLGAVSPKGEPDAELSPAVRKDAAEPEPQPGTTPQAIRDEKKPDKCCVVS